MSGLYALILFVVGGLFVYLAAQADGGFSLTQLNLAFYYSTVAFIAIWNGLLFSAVYFVSE
jgi:hypothetical protein